MHVLLKEQTFVSKLIKVLLHGHTCLQEVHVSAKLLMEVHLEDTFLLSYMQYQELICAY